MALGDLTEFNRYTAPERVGRLQDGSAGELDYLGSHYYQVAEDTGVRVSGDVVLAGPTGWGDTLELAAGDTLVVTGLAERGADYSLTLFELGAGDDTGGGAIDDTGGPLKPSGPPATRAAWDSASPPGGGASPSWACGDAGLSPHPSSRFVARSLSRDRHGLARKAA